MRQPHVGSCEQRRVGPLNLESQRNVADVRYERRGTNGVLEHDLLFDDEK